MEGKDSSYKGHFIEYVQELREVHGIKDLRTMTCTNVQKDLCCTSAFLVTLKIVKELGNDFFSILIDESGYCLTKEQMAGCLRFVDSKGSVVERFLGIAHVKETSSLSLKRALLDVLTPYQLSLSNIRGKEYDGESNMSGRLGGLKTLIQNEVPSVVYVHCFAHQLQLALIAAVSCHLDVSSFFGLVNSIFNIIGCSNKRHEWIREAQLFHLAELVEQGSGESGTG